jgi:hypothetical protein
MRRLHTRRVDGWASRPPIAYAIGVGDSAMTRIGSFPNQM